MKKTSLLILYEESHAKFATPGARVACLNFWLRQELKSRGSDCMSLGDHPPDDSRVGEISTAVHAASREWYRTAAMSFFEYKGIRIGEALEPMVDIYIGRLSYWRCAIESVLDAAPETTEIVLPHSDIVVLETAGPLALFEARAAVDVARILAKERNLAFKVIGDAPQPPVWHLYPRSRIKDLVVALYNYCIGLAPRRKLKIFASEYWRNIAPFIEKAADVELVLMESGEFRNIPWQQLWKHRIRFMHPRAVHQRVYLTTARSAAARFRSEWSAAKETLSEWNGWGTACASWITIEPALTYLVETYAERVVADIERIEYVLALEQPDKVLLRASVGSRQTHFFLTAKIARRLGRVSIEQQHAGAYIDPRAVHSRLETDYLASYGPYVREWYERNGYAPERIVPIGSPRFDRCITERGQATLHGQSVLREAGLRIDKPVLLCSVPDEGIWFGNDAYATAAFFRAIADAKSRLSELQVVFKFRPGNLTESSRAFVHAIIPDAVITAKDDLFSLVCASSIVVCGNSTVIYEALLGGRPLLLYPWSKNDIYHARMYSPAAPIQYDSTALTTEIARVLADDVYRLELVARGQEFLKGYCFDGKSAERMGVLLNAPLVSHVHV